MKSKVKRILLRVLIAIGVIIVVVLIWLACNYKYLTSLTLSYDTWGNPEVEYYTVINSGGIPQAEDAEEAIFYLKGQVIKGEVSISLYRVSDRFNDMEAMSLSGSELTAENGAILLYSGTFAEGDTIDVEQSLGSQKRGCYVMWVEQTKDLEIQIWENIDTYNYGWVHEKYRFLNRLRNCGLLHDRDDE